VTWDTYLASVSICNQWGLAMFKVAVFVGSTR